MKTRRWIERVFVYDVNGSLKRNLEKGEPVAAVSAFRFSKIPKWIPVSRPNFSETPRRGEVLDVAIDEAFVLYECVFLSDNQALLPQELEVYALRRGRTFWTLMLPEALGRSHIFIDPEFVFNARKQ